MLSVTCPHCHKPSRVPDEAAGKIVRCFCGQNFRIDLEQPARSRRLPFLIAAGIAGVLVLAGVFAVVIVVTRSRQARAEAEALAQAGRPAAVVVAGADPSDEKIKALESELAAAKAKIGELEARLRGVPQAATKAKYSREELRGLLDQKIEPDVLKLLGRPERTSEGGIAGDRTHIWYYDRLTFDPITQRVDRAVAIIFQPDNRLPDTAWRCYGARVEFVP
jgi:hypothetical protein